MKTQTTSERKPRQRHVWHVSRFRDRFEMPENLRKQRIQPLDFTRDFVASNAGMEAAKYQEQAAQLGNGDGMRHITLLGLFRELVNRASNQDRAWRGYLIDAERQPMSVGQLAKSLRWPTPELQKAMKELASAGLIERIAEPDYVADDEREFPPEVSEKPEKQRRRKSTERGGKRARPLLTDNGQVPCPKYNESEGRGLTAAPKEQEQGQGQPGGEAAAPPTTAPGPAPVPDDPKEPEAGSDRTARRAPGPTPSAQSSGPPAAVPIGQCIKIRDWDADAFGLQVFQTLELDRKYSPDSTEGKSEWKSFANWLVKAKGKAPSSAWQGLRERGLAKARHIAKHGKSARSPGAVWHRIMSGAVKQSKAVAS